jgi:hypothetical protein
LHERVGLRVTRRRVSPEFVTLFTFPIRRCGSLIGYFSRLEVKQSIAPARGARDLTAGLILIFSALVSLIVVAHHPVIKARETDELFAEMVKKAFADRIVHGALILLVILQLFAFCRFARRQNIERTPVLLGLLFYSLGTVAMIGAALVDGFLVPEVGARYFHASQATADAGLALLRFCSIAIQLFTKSSVIAIAMAILLWSFSFARAGRASLLAGLIGVAAVLSQAYILVLGGSIITAHTILFVAAPQMFWYIGVGLLLVGGEL